MAVDQAPWLTRRVVVGTMAAVFVLCVVADQLQCSKNGRDTFCTGKAPYRCDGYYCAENVELTSSFSFSHSCAARGAAEVLFGVVEVGPPLVSAHGEPLSSYLVKEIHAQVQSGRIPIPTGNGSAGSSMPNSSTSPRRYVVSDYVSGSYTIQALFDTPRNVTRYAVAADVIRLPPYRPGVPFAYRSWTEAAAAVLPTSSVDDPTQLKRYFPGVYGMIESAVARRKSSATRDSECDAIVLVFFLVLSPMSSIATLWGGSEDIERLIFADRTVVAGALTRYLTTHRRFLKYLDAVTYRQFYVSTPAQLLAVNDSIVVPQQSYTTSAPGGETVTASATADPTPTTNPAVTAAFCGATVNATESAACVAECATATAFSQQTLKRWGNSRWSQTACFEPSEWRFDASSCVRARDCYTEMVNYSLVTRSPGDSDAALLRAMMHDCYHLNPTGGMAFAACLLDE